MTDARTAFLDASGKADLARYRARLASSRREREKTAERARFADLLADGVDIPIAAASLGRTATWGRNNFARLRRELGEQAQ